MKKRKLFISLFLLNLLHTTFIHLQLSQPFLPSDWIYTTNGSCPVGCMVSDMFIEIFWFTSIVMMFLLVVEFVLSKIGIKNLYRSGVLATIYIYCYYWIIHLDASYCELPHMYDTYVVLYGVNFLVAYGVFYWLSKGEKG